MFTVDTNILIYAAAGDEKISGFLSKCPCFQMYLPTIVIAEVLSYSLLTSKDRGLFDSFFQEMILIPLDFGIAEIAANFRKKYKITLSDGIIAATAYHTNSTLLTRNIKHFKKLREIKLQKI